MGDVDCVRDDVVHRVFGVWQGRQLGHGRARGSERGGRVGPGHPTRMGE
jgi:hypothetical protein